RRAVERRVATRQERASPDRLLASMSHEMRNPLNGIMGWSTILREEGAAHLTRNALEALDRIQANSVTLLGHVENMCYLADIDRGYATATHGPVDVNALLAKVVDGLGPVLRGRPLVLRVVAAAGLRLESDGEKLHRLLRALADNAVQFSTEGEV